MTKLLSVLSVLLALGAASPAFADEAPPAGTPLKLLMAIRAGCNAAGSHGGSSLCMADASMENIANCYSKGIALLAQTQDPSEIIETMCDRFNNSFADWTARCKAAAYKGLHY